MDFEDSQFQGAASGGDGFDNFAAAVPAAPAMVETVTVENGGGLDDFFSGSAGAATTAAAPALTEAVIGEYAAPDVPELNAAAAAADVAPATDDDPFFQHYTPPPQPEPAPEPEVVDPRVEWRKQNNEQLKKKDGEESTTKQQLKEAGAKYLAKFYEVRTTTLTQRKANNRKSEAHQKEVEVPTSGTAWEKINALVNLNAGHHQKDVARYKAVLITCKAKNVAIHA